MDVLATITQAMHGSAESKRRCYEQLIGAEQGWLHACYQALAHGHSEWLRLQEPDPLWWAWQLIGELCERDEFRYAETARAIAACASVAGLIHSMAHNDQAQHNGSAVLLEYVLRATYQWQHSYALLQPAMLEEQVWRDCYGPVYQQHTPLPPEQQMYLLLTHLQQQQPAWQVAAVRDLIGFFLHGTPPPPAATQRIPVILDVGTYGLVADIHLHALPSGFGSCYADPCSMAFFHGDPTFFAALETTHTYARAHSGGDAATDVSWQLAVRPTMHHPTSGIDRVAGASMSAGFAVGMLHLLDPQCPDLDPLWAITGCVTPTGELLSVQGYPAKLETALEHQLRLIVPESDLNTLHRQWQGNKHILRIRGAATIGAASEIYSRRAQAVCPYRGLAVFTEQDAEHFAGRQRLIALKQDSCPDCGIRHFQPVGRLSACVRPNSLLPRLQHTGY